MRRKLLCGLAAFCWGSRALAQPVPARDLWEFPLGAVLEPAGLASEPGAGLWNPAAAALPRGDRWRLGVASLSAPSDQSVDGQLLTASLRRSSGTTLSLSIARSAVGAIVRTDADPEAIGEVPYSSLLYSFGAARALTSHLTAGVAMRVREGRADAAVGHAVAADLGILVHSLPIRDARIAVSSFLWRPGRELDDRPAFIAAVDARVLGGGIRELRAGYSQHDVNRGARERGLFLGGRHDRVEARAALMRTTAAGRSVARLRTGLAFHFATFVVGVAREEGASGLGELMQFTLSTTLR